MSASAAPETASSAFGRRTLELRLERGWSRPELSALTGVSASGIRRAERGDNVSLALADLIAGAFGMPLAAMLSPDSCRLCHGAPRPGFACMECDARGPEVTR